MNAPMTPPMMGATQKSHSWQAKAVATNQAVHAAIM